MFTKKYVQGWYRFNPVYGGILITIFLIMLFRYYYVQSLIPPSELFSIDYLEFTSTLKTEDNESRSVSQKRYLPDDWMNTTTNETEGWYQATINLKKTPSGLWAIYLPVVQMNANIYLNNYLVGQVGKPGKEHPHNDPFVRADNAPYYFNLPEGLLNKENNRLTLHVQAHHGSGMLGKIYLAEDSELRPVFNSRFSAIITSKKLITSGMLAIAVLMSVLWWLRRQDSVYGWYALMLYTWSAHNIFSMGVNMTLPQHTQNILALLTLGWFVVFMVKATHNYMGQQFPVRERIMVGIAFFGSMAIVFSSYLPWPLLLTHQFWSTFVLSLAGYALLDFVVKYRERDDLQNPLIIPAGFSMMIFGTHDWLLLVQVLPRDEGRLLHFSAPVSVSVFGALLLERFAKTLKQAEHLNLELEFRVAEKHKQLEKNYQKIRIMEHKQLLADERERFMKEIHDGVGGHLISMLSMVRSGKQDADILVRAIESTLEDLRIMIDSLTPQEHDIPSLLGAMRIRIEPQLQASGLELHWQVSELPTITDFGPHKALQVMRIVQEAIANVIRHAGAKKIVIKAFAENNVAHRDVIIEICDDGTNTLLASKNGRGLSNMQRRASEIGAVLDIEGTESGTTVRLRFSTTDG